MLRGMPTAVWAVFFACAIAVLAAGFILMTGYDQRRREQGIILIAAGAALVFILVLSAKWVL